MHLPFEHRSSVVVPTEIRAVHDRASPRHRTADLTNSAVVDGVLPSLIDPSDQFGESCFGGTRVDRHGYGTPGCFGWLSWARFMRASCNSSSTCAIWSFQSVPTAFSSAYSLPLRW